MNVTYRLGYFKPTPPDDPRSTTAQGSRAHPGSGRKALYIGAHARRVIGMALPAGRILLRDLLEHATQPEFVYRHAWRPGDLVLWDNRAELHRGCRYDRSQVRDMRRTTVLDPASVFERDCGEDLVAA